MNITIGEDNAFLFNGVPSLVVVSVSFDDGRVVRFPYEAGKTIAGLYKDLAGMNKQDIQIVGSGTGLPMNIAPGVPTPVSEYKERLMPSSNPTKIERGDTVTCVFLTNRNDHMGKPATEDLAVGGKYRVTKVLPGGYEVLDDAAPMKFKLFLARNEVELTEKGKPTAKKVTVKEVDLVCPECNETVYCADVKGVYTGKCECGKVITKSKAEWDKEHPVKVVVNG